jgi:hypothetical protein
MYESLRPQPKDPQRLFENFEKELIYYSDGKRCVVCQGAVGWYTAALHNIKLHSQGGKTILDNGALVHGQCHPKGAAATQEFEKKFSERIMSGPAKDTTDFDIVDDDAEDEEENGEQGLK